VRALTYVIDRAHSQYAGAVTVEEAARIVEGAVGRSGPNPVYVANTVAHLRELGIRDHWLESVASAVVSDPADD
jgi:cation transport protein ChaC